MRLPLKSFTDSVSTHVGFSEQNYYTTTLHHIIILTAVHRQIRLSVTKLCLSVTTPSGASHINVIEEPLQSSIRVLAGYPPPCTSIDEITTRRCRPRHKVRGKDKNAKYYNLNSNHIYTHTIILYACAMGECACGYYTNARVIVEITHSQHHILIVAPPPHTSLRTASKINNSGGLTSGTETALQRNAYLWHDGSTGDALRHSLARKSGKKN